MEYNSGSNCVNNKMLEYDWLLTAFIIWRATRPGKMKDIPRCDWLPERARWSDFPFCSRNNISPKSKRVHESFLSQSVFRYSKKIFCDFSDGVELENEKTESRHHFCIYVWELHTFTHRLHVSYNSGVIVLIISIWIRVGHYQSRIQQRRME